MPRLIYSLPGPEVIKLFPYSTQLSTKFILLINVKMPTLVGILTFISMINATSERLKARNFFICRYFSFYEQLYSCSVELRMKKFYNLGTRLQLVSSVDSLRKSLDPDLALSYKVSDLIWIHSNRLIELRLKVPVNNISVMSGLLPERGR